MKLSPTLAKSASISIIFIVALTAFLYWLWQRQPNPNESAPQTTQTQEIIQEKIDEIQLEIAPIDGTILDSNNVAFKGTTLANNYVILSSNNSLGITQANENGQFEIDSELVAGLSLINIIAIDQDLSEKQTVSLTLYVESKSLDTTVFAGPAKSIFDNIITITTTQGEQTIRQKTSTELILPDTEDAEDNDIRVGDFLIALGSIENEKDFNATKIEVIREDKPQNLEKYVAGTLLSNVKENIFSMRNQKDSNIVEFTANENTAVSENGREAEIEDIAKDRKAIIIYFTEENENIPDLIYLLP